MTSRTDTTTDVHALAGQAELFDLDAELVGLTDDAAAAASVAAEVAAIDANAARAARKEQRATSAAWIALVAGAVISLGAFASIAWHDSVAANGPGTSVETTTAP